MSMTVLTVQKLYTWMHPSHCVPWAVLTARVSNKMYAIMFVSCSEEDPEPLVTNAYFLFMVVMILTMKTN